MPKKDSKSIEKPHVCVLAVHRDVESSLADWRSDTNYLAFATKVDSLLGYLRRGELNLAQIVHDQIFHTMVKGVKNLIEHGQTRNGGAPRLFEWRVAQSHIFLSAGIEKSNRGCQALGTATRRQSELLKETKKKHPKSLPSLADASRWLGSAYSVEGIRSALGRGRKS